MTWNSKMGFAKLINSMPHEATDETISQIPRFCFKNYFLQTHICTQDLGYKA
jgi:hypothetical protein